MSETPIVDDEPGEHQGSRPIIDPVEQHHDWRPRRPGDLLLDMSTEDAKQKLQNVEELKPDRRYADAP